ncbi:hypothetical protein NHQ30_000887 [Ciborinia camelliae]|nr:hypothetical protein NHQ30_000887 [Ciborinia camelliae]
MDKAYPFKGMGSRSLLGVTVGNMNGLSSTALINLIEEEDGDEGADYHYIVYLKGYSQL